MHKPAESLAALLRRFADPPDDQLPDVPRVRFEDALRQGDDPLHILPYLASLGIVVRAIDDLLLINGDQAEEEIHAFRVAEGVAAVVASEGAWILFQH